MAQQLVSHLFQAIFAQRITISKGVVFEHLLTALIHQKQHLLTAVIHQKQPPLTALTHQKQHLLTALTHQKQHLLTALTIYQPSINRVDPSKTALRWGALVRRRTYYVPWLNSLWHIDGHHALIC